MSGAWWRWGRQPAPTGDYQFLGFSRVHRSQEVWGDDAEEFRPERWLERDVGKEFNPFSFGPRACVGRNLASMEVLIIIASVFHRYNFQLSEPDQKLYTREGFLRKPLECVLGVERRDVNLPQ
ncbi:putative cytochrome P450 family benzoate 4-monooxygenase [Rhizoctonia solani 123E]|uniref:Putative cytochrome P450 family benzoate 4-monooxygenase n=1 Tax=Rhizoctonia solani 123E TaxID=1423351 RepID=A0A074RL95_9AGAM|nr:putative cytochrome P450 family benzoate 4-monooxygenase [Rhizoctonia solani 123E]